MRVLHSVVQDPSKRLIILSNNYRVFIVRVLLMALNMQCNKLSNPHLWQLADQLLLELNAWIVHWSNIPHAEEIKPGAPNLSFSNGELLLYSKSRLYESEFYQQAIYSSLMIAPEISNQINRRIF